MSNRSELLTRKSLQQWRNYAGQYCFRQKADTYWAPFCSNLNPDFDHVNGLDDTGGSHTTETTIQERLGCFPGRAQVFPLKVCHLQVGNGTHVNCDGVWCFAAIRCASSTLMARDRGLGPFQQRNCVRVADGDASHG